ncbi:MAG: DUF3291 domain-containing protein [Betaproteobacteria bacterium]|nr:DUF3291 domain-containing protein [Betaproteobacteria bacterium]
MSAFQLAQLNVATPLEALDSPRLADFVANLDRINALAEQSPGFAWRLVGDAVDAKGAYPLGREVIATMSVWDGLEALQAFAFRSGHADVMKRRREWFAKMTDAYVVLWWVPRGHRPDVNEAADRLALLRAHGPTAKAFSFKDAFPAPDAEPAGQAGEIGDSCPA